MTMSLFHNLKLKRRKVDSRSSSDGSEAAATDMMMNPPSLASSSELAEEPRPSSRHSSTSFEVEVKPNKFELNAPRYTTWASPAKLKQEPMYADDAPTLTATVVPKVFSNGSPTSTSSSSAATPSSSHTLPSSDRLTTSPAAIIQQTSIQVRPPLSFGGGHRLAEALRPPPVTSVPMSTAAHHLPIAAAAAAVKLQAMHPNLVSSSANHPHSIATLGSLQPTLHQPHSQPILRMVTPPTQFHQKPTLPPKTILEAPSQTRQIPVSSSAAKLPQSDGPGSNGTSSTGNRKNGPSVILGEHGGVKTMIWTDSTTYWQNANKHRNLQVLPSQQQPQQLPSQPAPPGPLPTTTLPLQPPRHQLPPPGHPASVPISLGAQQPPPVPSLPPGSRALLMPPVPVSTISANIGGGGPPTSLALKVEKPAPADHEQQLKMSSAVDGLLSLSSQGAGGRSPYPHIIASPIAPPQMVQISPVHLSHGSNHPSPASTPARLSNSSVSSSPVPDISANGLNPSPSPFNQNQQQHGQPPRRRSPMNMERLWAGDMSQLPSHVLESQNGHTNAAGFRPPLDQEEEEPLLCNICEDRATGLHYGIITCEG